MAQPQKTPTNKIRIAAMADIHVREGGAVSYQDIFSKISQEADALLLCGDLTHHGLPAEADLLAKELSACKIPVLCVLGNHDYDQGYEHQIKQILTQSRVMVMEGDSYEIQGVGFAGVKGFGGGFEKYMLSSFGEIHAKKFVDAAIAESMGLEKALSSLETEKKVVLLHYSPIRETIQGEPLEIYPFLGCTRLLEPIERFEADVVFHGHAHGGSPEGKTPRGTPVYNVAHPLMMRLSPGKPYKIVEVG